jgi:hypothetical protein
VEYAAEQAGYAPGDYEVAMMAESPGLFDMFEGGSFIKVESRDLAGELLYTLLGKESIRALQWMTVLREQPFLYWTPAL